MEQEFQLRPGEKRFTSIFIEAQHDRVELPLFLVKGKKDGPLLFIISGEHGTELSGPEMIRRLIEEVNPEELSGSIVAVPVVNPRAIRSKQHSYPYDKWVWFNSLNDMNRAWPGKQDGSINEATTAKLYDKFMTKADVFISLHGTNFTPYLQHDPNDEKAGKLCLDFGRIAHIRSKPLPAGSCFSVATKLGIPAMLIEYPPLRHVNPIAIADGLKGLKNILISLKMTAGKINKIRDQFILTKENALQTIEAEDDAIIVREKPWGAHVKKGDVIARLYDLYKYREVQVVKSPIDGLLWCTAPSPGHLSTFFMHTDSVCRGETVAQIFSYSKHIENPDGDDGLSALLGGQTCSMEMA